MKKLVLVAVVSMCLCVCSIAQAEPIRTVTGAMLDAPNLIRFTENLTLGVEGGKDIYTNPFQESALWIEDDKGYFGYLKVTWTGSLLNFAKK